MRLGNFSRPVNSATFVRATDRGNVRLHLPLRSDSTIGPISASSVDIYAFLPGANSHVEPIGISGRPSRRGPGGDGLTRCRRPRSFVCTGSRCPRSRQTVCRPHDRPRCSALVRSRAWRSTPNARERPACVSFDPQLEGWYPRGFGVRPIRFMLRRCGSTRLWFG